MTKFNLDPHYIHDIITRKFLNDTQHNSETRSVTAPSYYRMALINFGDRDCGLSANCK